MQAIVAGERSVRLFQKFRGLIAAFLIYLLLALAFFGRSADWTGHYAGTGHDPQVSVWFIHWWPFAITHGLNPFISHYVWAPYGFNLTWATSMPTADLLSLPAALLGGPVLAYNLLSVSAPALSAFTAFLLARHLTQDWAAAVMGGFFYGFSSYEDGQMLGHLNLTLNFAIPLIVLLCRFRFERRIGRGAFLGRMAGLFLLQLGISTEILLTSCCFGATCLAVFLLFAPAAAKPAFLRLSADILVAGFIAVAVASPFLYFIVTGLQNTPDIINTPAGFSADLLNYLLPTPATRIGRAAFAPITSNFTANTSEQGAYLGLPLLFLMALYFLRASAQRYEKALFSLLALLVIASFGPSLHIGGFVTTLAMPWRMVDRLPLLDAVLPGRFTMYVGLIAAVVVAHYLSRHGAGRSWRFLLSGLAAIFLLPNPSFPWSAWPAEPFFSPPNVAHALGVGRIVLILPFGQGGPGMAWQLDAGMTFRQAGGYAGFTPRQEQAFPIISEFANNAVWPGFNNDLAAYCATHHVDYLLIGPGTQPAIAAAIYALGWPLHADHGVQVVQVPAPSSLDYYYVQGDFWPSAAPQNFMGREITVITHGEPVDAVLTGNGYIPKSLIITQTSAAGRKTFSLDNGMVTTIHIPADFRLTLTASQTFIPDRVIHNGDQRNLSILVGFIPGKRS